MTSDEKRYDNRAFDQEQQPLPPSYPSQQYPQGAPPTAVAYGGKYPTQQGQTVITTQPQQQGMVIVQPVATGNATSALVLAVISILCCGNLILGLIALFFWYEADQALKNGDTMRGQEKKKVSLILSIVGIVIMVIVIVIIIILYVVVSVQAATAISNAYSGYNG